MMNIKLTYKRLIAPIFIFLMLSWYNGFAQEVRGVVVNGSRQGNALANIPVMLQKAGAMDTIYVDIVKSVTNRHGQFQFKEEFSDTTALYFAAVDYQGARYYSNSSDPLQQKIVVFDSTHNTSRLSAVMHHVIISKVGERLKIKETRIIQNADSLAIPCKNFNDTDGKPLFYFALPEGYANLKSVSMTFGNRLVAGGNNLFFLGVIHPGNNPVSYTYELPFTKKTAAINLPVLQMTRSLDVFSSDPSLKITAEQLHDEGPFTIRGIQYQRFNTRNLAPGSMLAFTVAYSVDHRPQFLIFGLLALAIALFSVLNYLFKRNKRRSRKLSIDPVVKLKDRRRELIDSIAMIDSREGKQNNQTIARRQQLFDELQSVELALQEFMDKQKGPA